MGKLSKELRMSIHNRFDIEVVDVKTGKVKQRAQAFNVVCVGYWQSWFRQSSRYPRATEIAIGSGTGTPSASDTDLFHFEAYVAYNSTFPPQESITSDNANGTWRRLLRRTLGYDQCVGVNITEVGLVNTSSGRTICTHAMLQDMNGNPISLVHTDTDVINFYCNIYLHYDNQDGDIHIYDALSPYQSPTGYPGCTQDYEGLVRRLLLSAITNNNYAENHPTQYARGVQGSGVVRDTGSTDAAYRKSYVDDYANKTMKLAWRLDTTVGNINGMGTLMFDCGSKDGRWETNVTDVIIEVGKTTVPPQIVTDESVGVGDGSTTKYKTKIAYPYNATVRINGQAANATVKKAPCLALGSTTIDGTTVGYPSHSYTTYGSVFYREVYPENVKVPKPNTSNSGYCYISATNGQRVVEILSRDVGVAKAYMYQSAGTATLECSNDGVTWTTLYTKTTSGYSYPTIDSQYANARYFRLTSSGATGSEVRLYFNTYDGYNIIFDNPPAQGDVITIDYTTDYIPKDSDHVLDVELTFTFGEWQGN